MCVNVNRNLHADLAPCVSSSKTTLVSKEVATFWNTTVKISKPGFKISAWPFYQEYEEKWSLTTSTSPGNGILFSANIKPVKSLLKNRGLWQCTPAEVLLSGALLVTPILFHLTCLPANHSWSVSMLEESSQTKYYWPPRWFIQQLRAASNMGTGYISAGQCHIDMSLRCHSQQL